MGQGGSLDKKIYSLFKKGVFEGKLTIIGSPQRAIDLTAITITPSTDRSYAALALGHRGGTTLDFTMTAAAVAQHVDPIQIEIAIKGINPGATSTVNAIYQQITHATANMAALRLKNADWTLIVSKNLMDAYCLQTEIDITATAGVSGQCAAVSAAIQISGTGTIGEVQALYASVGGAGVFTSNEVTVGKFVYSNSGKKAKAVIEINVPEGPSVAKGILFDGDGAWDNIIDFGSVTYLPMGSGKSVISIGKRGTAKSVNMTDRFEPIQLVLTSAAAPSVAGTTMNLIYADLQTGIAQANARLKVADWTIGVNHALTDAYVTQMELDQAGAGAVTGQMCTLSATMQLAGTATIGECQALYVSVGGSGAITTDELTVAKIGLSASGKKAKAIIESGAAAYASASALLLIDGEGAIDSAIKLSMGSGSGITNLFEFVTDGTKDCIVAGGSGTPTLGSGQWRKIPVKIGSATFYLLAATTITNS